MIEYLRQDEVVVADNGYHQISCVTPNTVVNGEKEMHKRLRVCHKSCNACLKVFIVLNCTFNQCIARHNAVFYAVAKIVALSI